MLVGLCVGKSLEDVIEREREREREVLYIFEVVL
jgi:hypothetical protein